jgi:HD-like signal output (HDOD) protein
LEPAFANRMWPCQHPATLVSEGSGMKKTILFVDDDPLLLNVYAVMMDDAIGDWEIDCAENGLLALEILARKKFDVVVSDLRMPGMDGITLMREIRRLYPHTSRIIVSGVEDQEQIASGLATTHQFLSKPFKLRELAATLSCIGQLDAFLQDEKLKALVSNLDSLPSFPTAFIEITRELNAGEPSVENIADIAIKDPGLTAKMLQVANSAAFGLGQKVSSPFEAVQFIGLAAVRSIALSVHVFRNFENIRFKGFFAHQLWNEALRCAQIARLIMQLENSDENQVEDAGTAAMLRNAGKLMLAQSLPQPFQQAIALAVERKLTLPEAEQEILGATHAGIAAYLLGLWGLSAPMVEGVAFHLQPAQGGSRQFSPLTAVHVAHVLAEESCLDQTSGKPAKLDRDYLASIGCDHRLDYWRAEAKRFTHNP